jgi:hypothetical protein
MILQIRPTAFHHFVAGDREFDQAESAKNLVKPMAIERREGLLIVGKVLGNLVHLRCLIHRTADEEDLFSHWFPPPALSKAPHNKVMSIIAMKAPLA